MLHAMNMEEQVNAAGQGTARVNPEDIVTDSRCRAVNVDEERGRRHCTQRALDM